MLTNETAQEIADGWVQAFSVDPYVVREREMDAWHKLDALVFNEPLDALLVFERVSQKDLTNWTFEGFAAGPIRTFLMLYGERYDDAFSAIIQRNRVFAEMRALAAEGL
jgi:hypothetical protein